MLLENEMLCPILESEFPGELTVYREEHMERLLARQKKEPADLVIWDLTRIEARTGDALRQLQRWAGQSVILFLADVKGKDKLPLQIPAGDYLYAPCTHQEMVLTLEEALWQCRKRKADREEKNEDSARLSLIREKIESYIRAHYSENLSMQDVAQAMNYSETHFCRLFKSCFKVNFSVYLNEFRVEQAKHMLLSTSLSVKEIALNCGYRDTSYFIRVFKRFTDTTPMDYRIYMQTMTTKKYNES